MNSMKPEGYSPLQKALHWLVALMALIMIPVGLYMVQRGAATKFDALTNQLYTMHKTFGFILLWLVVLRITVKFRTGTPAPEASLKPIQVFVSEAVHLGLYALLFLTPLFGWLAVSSYPATEILFGLNLPQIAPVNERLHHLFMLGHKITAYLMAGLVAAHIGAAMLHLVILKDGVFRRMLP